MTMLSDPKYIEYFRKKALLSAMQLEAMGMKRSGPSALSIVKKEYGFKGNRAFVIKAFKEYCLNEKEVLIAGNK